MSKTNIKPLGTRVLVEVVESEEKTISGIIIPDSAKEKQQKGTVLAVGKGTEKEKMEVKVGDLVVYGKYAGTEIEDGGKSYLILNQSDILATL
ncbi:MAG: co-chaperone GroES [Bacteroidetes bacterium CG2_30_33_31]|nr:MAG: co-chaperone GroES [Bacteroidetes bacterium CG2_30_33_31]